MNKPVLVIMAAGLGSRYGGLKQMDPMDAYGNLIIDFSIYDAIRAGFEKVVFIVKEANVQDFKDTIGKRISPFIEVEYAIQDMADIPEGYVIPDGRVKPWGTGHAILACAEAVKAPFAAINADDYYGPEAFKQIYDFLANAEDDDRYQYAMIGYLIENTVTEHGTVARGVCAMKDGYLTKIDERTKIEKRPYGAAFTEDDGQTWTDLPAGTPVSMNFWGFTPGIMDELKERFVTFLDKVADGREDRMKGEFYIPKVVGELVDEDRAVVKVLTSSDKWYGVTYKEDKPGVMAALQALKDAGVYPETLWQK
ncbi:MAG: nucleotidyltransferase [Lachnospiraceae bacterium]|nr:nucleotidyltransferase [Lachnospiraceae bacterium]